MERFDTVTESLARQAVESALASWEQAGVGLSFALRSESSDLVIAWYDPTTDPECRRFGCQLGPYDHAHADLPPPNTLFSGPPLPIHFHAGERWATEGQPQAFDIESVALHELGHCLGLFHGPIGTVMEPTFTRGRLRRTLDTHTLQRIRRLYGASQTG